MCDGFDEGQAEEWDDDEGDFLAEQGEEGLLQRSLPQVKPPLTWLTAL